MKMKKVAYFYTLVTVFSLLHSSPSKPTCPNGLYYSFQVDDCNECPKDPIHCNQEHTDDIYTCFVSCKDIGKFTD